MTCIFASLVHSRVQIVVSAGTTPMMPLPHADKERWADIQKVFQHDITRYEDLLAVITRLLQHDEKQAYALTLPSPIMQQIASSFFFFVVLTASFKDPSQQPLLQRQPGGDQQVT